MSNQKFSAVEREAFWLAHSGKCAYSRELLDLTDLHLDHIIPEEVASDPARFDQIRAKLGLPPDFDVFGYANLVPCKARVNLQKGKIIFDESRANYFLGIAFSKADDVRRNITKIERRISSGKAAILLQQCLEKGAISGPEMASLMEKYADNPEQVFHLLEGLKFAESDDVGVIERADLESLRDRPLRIWHDDEESGIVLVNDASNQLTVRTCREFDRAIADGYYPCSNLDIKMSSIFFQQCGLITALESVRSPRSSFIESPRHGIFDFALMPFSLFPHFGPEDNSEAAKFTFQEKLDDGTLHVTMLRHNMIRVVSDGMGLNLVEVARGDFSGEGFEEILLFEYCFATQGTLGYGGLRLLTRTSSDGKFENVPLKCRRVLGDSHI